jgi:hypothetical protein
MSEKSIIEDLKELAVRFSEKAIEMEKSGYKERAISWQAKSVGVLHSIELLGVRFGVRM